MQKHSRSHVINFVILSVPLTLLRVAIPSHNQFLLDGKLCKGKCSVIQNVVFVVQNPASIMQLHFKVRKWLCQHDGIKIPGNVRYCKNSTKGAGQDT